jgi:hypothetical protein
MLLCSLPPPSSHLSHPLLPPSRPPSPPATHLSPPRSQQGRAPPCGEYFRGRLLRLRSCSGCPRRASPPCRKAAGSKCRLPRSRSPASWASSSPLDRASRRAPGARLSWITARTRRLETPSGFVFCRSHCQANIRVDRRAAGFQGTQNRRCFPPAWRMRPHYKRRLCVPQGSPCRHRLVFTTRLSLPSY